MLFCRLVASTLHGRRVAMQPAAANIVCGSLRRWADSYDAADEADEAGDRQLQVEALHALSALLQDNLAQVGHWGGCKGGRRLQVEGRRWSRLQDHLVGPSWDALG